LLWELSVSRRRAALLNEAECPESLLRFAEFLYDTGDFTESIEYTTRVTQAPSNEYNLVRASALRCRAEFLLGKGRAAKVHLEEFDRAYADSDIPFVMASRALVHGAYLAGGATEEPDTFPRAIKYFQAAADLYESCGEIKLAILCRIKLSATFSPAGSYLRAIREIEHAMDLATEHSSFHYTGRMLAIGCSSAADQGYRKGVEATLHRAIEWCEFVGDFWGRTQALYILGRLTSYQIPSDDPVAATRPERYLRQAIEAAEAKGAVGLAAHVTATLAWLYEKSGDLDRRQQLLDQEEQRIGGRRKHFDGMFKNTGEVAHAASTRIPARLQDGVENHPDAFFTFDVRRGPGHDYFDFINEYRNNAAAKILGLAPSTVFLYSEFQDSPYLRGLTSALLDAVDNQTTFQDECGGETVWFTRRIVPSGNGAVLIIRDTTAEHQIEMALRNAAESAERSDRAKSEFLANMSHEIRTPVNGVLGLARLLADTQLDPIQRAYIDDIVGSGDILISVIGNILDLSKMESQSMPLDIRPCVIEEVVTSTVRLFLGQASEKGVRLTTTIDPSTPRVILADGARIRQVIANLVGNALKFTQEGSVAVTVAMDGDQMSIDVVDTGMGIPEDRLEAIFDRFQQASADSRVFGGTGLGLTISKGIVQLMGGTITVESQLGNGSRFVLRLPVVETTDTRALRESTVPQRFDGIHVLLVDDNRVNKMVSTYSLEKLGCTVSIANNGAEALEQWETGVFDLVLMDIRMPVMDGLEATRELRRREASKSERTPVIALTAGALLEERSECFEAGMDDYISKPFSDDLLREVIARWLPKIMAVDI